MKHLIDILDLSLEEIDELIATACDIMDNPDNYAEACKRKKLATLFFEPSTRTRLSFDAVATDGKEYQTGGERPAYGMGFEAYELIDAAAAGKIAPTRLESYRAIYKTLKEKKKFN